jgi:hypothetical protein
MKLIILNIFIIFISFYCYSQTSNILNKGNTKLISKPLYSFNSVNISSSKASVTNCIPKNNSILFDLQHFSINTNNYYKNSYLNSDVKEMVVYNRNHYYYLADPIHPYGNCEFALIGGTINYLILLLNN